MKRIFTILAAVLCAVATFAHDFVKGGIYYKVTSYAPYTVEVSYEGSSYSEYSNEYTSTVVIPSTVENGVFTYSVTSIGDYAFYDCSKITSVTIPNSVTSIGEGAFVGCSGLTSIEIPNSVTSVGNGVFSGCSGLSSVTIGNSVTSIGDYAFNRCSKITSVTIGNSVTSIGDYAFEDCFHLTSIEIPNSVTSVGNGVFSGCSGLSSVTIGNSVTSIGSYAFEDCSNLTSIEIPNSVTSIGESAFEDCSNLTSIEIPNSVTSIGAYAFYDCSDLSSVTIGNSVTNIGYGVFYGTEWWDNQPDGLMYINNVLYLYKGTMPENTSITIKEGTVSISPGAFEDCSGLASIEIPNSVTSIGGGAFYGCSGLTSIEIPNSVTNIGYGVFYGTEWWDNQPDGLMYINNVLYLYKGTMPENTSITIKEGTVSISPGAFEDCSGLASIEIPNSVTSIGGGAFYGCSGLTSIVIPNSVTTIGEEAFRNCTELGRVTIGISVTSIGYKAFDGCIGLVKITLKSSEPPVCGSDVFGEAGSQEEAEMFAFCALYVPAGSGEIYKNEEPWKNFSIVESKEVQYNIVAVSSGGGTVSGARKFDKGETVTITATPKDGYIFEKWLEDGEDASTANPYIFTATADVTLVAVFKAKTTTALEDVAAAAFSAYAAGGMVYCTAEEFQIFTIGGTNVTNRNGNLPAGVYVVAAKEGRTKVVVR